MSSTDPEDTHAFFRDIDGNPTINLYNATSTDIRRVHGDPKITLVGKNMKTTIDGVYGSPEMFITENPLEGAQGGSIERSWEKVTEELNMRDDERIRKWENGIDMLVVVSGISSLVFAFFTIESSRWLSEDPLALLSQISQQLQSQVQTPIPPFQPSLSVIIINCLWFVSLILAMACVVVGLLCKQWLQEHFQYNHTRTPIESLALRRLRRDSLERWGVPIIMGNLPILLEFAFLLFFGGLLVLFWLRHIALFIVGIVVIVIVFIFYSITTLLPSIQIVNHALQSQPYNDNPATVITHLSSLRSVCPYKTPQSWVAFAVMRAVLVTSPMKHVLHRLSRTSCFGLFRDALDRDFGGIVDWPSLDLGVIRTLRTVKNAPPVYEVLGLHWLLKTFRDTPSMVPHLTNIVKSLPPTLGTLVTNTAFDDWNFFIWKRLERTDIEGALKDRFQFFGKEHSDKGLPGLTRRSTGPSPGSPIFTQLVYYLSSWGNDAFDWKSRYEMTQMLYWTDVPLRAGMPFVVPFHELEKLWCSVADSQVTIQGAPLKIPSDWVYEQGIALEFLYFYQLGWDIASRLNSGHHDKLALVQALTNHIYSYESNPSSSAFFKSSKAFDFLNFIDSRIMEEGLNENGDWIFANILPKWRRALGRMRTILEEKSYSNLTSKVTTTAVQSDKPSYAPVASPTTPTLFNFGGRWEPRPQRDTLSTILETDFTSTEESPLRKSVGGSVGLPSPIVQYPSPALIQATTGGTKSTTRPLPKPQSFPPVSPNEMSSSYHTERDSRGFSFETSEGKSLESR